MSQHYSNKKYAMPQPYSNKKYAISQPYSNSSNPCMVLYDSSALHDWAANQYVPIVPEGIDLPGTGIMGYNWP